MPRTSRAQSETAIYHVMLRGINQQSIFEDSEDCQQFLAYLAEVKEISKFELFTYCLMGNHAHLLLKETDEPLSQIFKRLGARYVWWFNGKYQRTGHLFQDRFKSEPVQDEAYFITVLRYIHHNPVKAGLSKTPEAYEWSSLRLLKQKDPLISWSALEKIVPLDEIDFSPDKNTEHCPLEITPMRTRMYSDQAARELLKQLCGAKSLADFQKIDKATQRALLPKLRIEGLSIKQIARLTGLSKGIVERWSKSKTRK